MSWTPVPIPDAVIRRELIEGGVRVGVLCEQFTLYECDECAALVAGESKDAHEAWHVREVSS